MANLTIKINLTLFIEFCANEPKTRKHSRKRLASISLTLVVVLDLFLEFCAKKTKDKTTYEKILMTFFRYWHFLKTNPLKLANCKTEH